MNLSLLAQEIRTSNAPPEIVESLIQTLGAYVKEFPAPPGQTLAAEKEFCIPKMDGKDRPYYLVGRRDWEGLVGSGANRRLVLGEFKTHRGPWRKNMSVDDMLSDYWLSWRMSWQAAVYLDAMAADYAGSYCHSLGKPDTFIVRVGVKPGPYNAAAAREQVFQYAPEHHKWLLMGFYRTIDQMIDSLEVWGRDCGDGANPNSFPLRPFACFNKYKKECEFFSRCSDYKGDAPGARPASHLDVANTLMRDHPEIPWFDVSSVSLFAECPQKWYRTYLLGESHQENPAFVEGSLFHRGLEIIHQELL